MSIDHGLGDADAVPIVQGVVKYPALVVICRNPPPLPLGRVPTKKPIAPPPVGVKAFD